MSNLFRSYDSLYPDLVVEILEYFCISNAECGGIKNRSVVDFCTRHNEPSGDGALRYQPDTVNRICQKLCDKNGMISIKNDGMTGTHNNYLYAQTDIESLRKERTRIRYYYNSMVYGFDYIYKMYQDVVVPLICQKSKSNHSMGTGFKFLDGIITAKHYIEDADNMQIKGYSASELNNSKIYISTKPGIDIAFIQTNQLAEPTLYTAEGEILQEVLVMGYPKIPTFTDFLTAEKATISSKAEARITPTTGAIAAYGYQYLSKMEAMLITARIRGGNSGGPVINENGCLVGVACQVPDYSNNDNNYYDDLGYGIAVPIKYAIEIVNDKTKTIDVSANYFQNYGEAQ